MGGLGIGEALNPVFQLQQGGMVSFRNGAFSTYSEKEDRALLHLQNAERTWLIVLSYMSGTMVVVNKYLLLYFPI